MKPVAIFRHSTPENAGYFAQFLTQQGVPLKMIYIDMGDAVPEDVGEFSGLVFMGGTMSVNDDLPWLPLMFAMIRDAYARDIPMLGHCLGGQLMAKALGGEVTKNPVKELGWGRVEVADSATARKWFGNIRDFDSFHWHGETFSLPQDAELLLSSAHCVNQAFAIGKHLAMQCHVEMTEPMIREWCKVGAAELAANAASPAVQSAELMLAQMEEKLPELHRVADQLYRHWLLGLAI
jgi:GMP synthase-like glutamine amidotransferase